MTKGMIAGRDTGSLMNHVASRCASPEPEVGMGATRLGWTDRHACTVIAMEAAGQIACKAGMVPVVITVQDDNATRTDKNGMSESQSYAYTPNPNGPTRTYKRTRDGGWRLCHKSAANRWVFTDGNERLLVGVRDHYYDFSF